MSTTVVQQIVSRFLQLPSAEQQQVIVTLGSLLAQRESSLEDQVEQGLLARGLISRIPPPITDFEPYRNRKPVKIQGKALSETIVEERR